MGRLAEDFLLYTNTRVSFERAESRTTILNLERTSTVMLSLLMVSVVFWSSRLIVSFALSAALATNCR